MPPSRRHPGAPHLSLFSTTLTSSLGATPVTTSDGAGVADISINTNKVLAGSKALELLARNDPQKLGFRGSSCAATHRRQPAREGLARLPTLTRSTEGYTCWWIFRAKVSAPVDRASNPAHDRGVTDFGKAEDAVVDLLAAEEPNTTIPALLRRAFWISAPAVPD